MEKITLSTETINKVLAYLDTRPHGEVRGLIDAIIKEAKENENDADDDSRSV